MGGGGGGGGGSGDSCAARLMWLDQDDVLLLLVSLLKKKTTTNKATSLVTEVYIPFEKCQNFLTRVHGRYEQHNKHKITSVWFFLECVCAGGGGGGGGGDTKRGYWQRKEIYTQS